MSDTVAPPPPYRRKNRVKEKLRNGQPVLGMEVWLRDPRVVELLGQSGFDFAHIENEHVARDWSEIENFVRAADVYGMTTLFRCEQTVDGHPPANQILKALKCGAQILMVPQIETVDSARELVEIVKYPPHGRHGYAPCERGLGSIRPLDGDLQEITGQIEDEVLTWVIIESPLAVRNVDAILAVDGIDAVGFGPGDYSLTAGLRFSSAPEVADARQQVQDAAKRAGKHYWWTTTDAATIPEFRSAGVQIALLGGEILHLERLLRTFVGQANALETA